MHPKTSTDKISSNCAQKSGPIVLRDSETFEFFEKFVGRTILPEKKSQNDNESAKVLENNNKSPVNFPTISDNPEISILEAKINDKIVSIIDDKLEKMEMRLMQRIEQLEQNTNRTLDEILKKLNALKK